MFLQIVRNEWRHVAFPVARCTLYDRAAPEPGKPATSDF